VSDQPSYQLPRQTNFETSLDLARQTLSGLDFDRQCQRAGLEPGPDGTRVKLINRDYFISRNNLALTPADSGPAPE
jgi:hypothetical protein